MEELQVASNVIDNLKTQIYIFILVTVSADS